jgi:hypothetical protein
MQDPNIPLFQTTRGALLPEPVFHPTTTSITPILNMQQVAIMVDYRYPPDLKNKRLRIKHAKDVEMIN